MSPESSIMAILSHIRNTTITTVTFHYTFLETIKSTRKSTSVDSKSCVLGLMKLIA